MESEWKVQSNTICNKIMYIAYRIKDMTKVVHSGNMEHYGNYCEDKAVVQAIVDRLNEED